MIYICYVYSLFLFISSVLLFIFGMNFMVIDYSLMIEYKLVVLNSMIIYYSVLFDWMSLIFMSFVLYISSAVILYSNDYMSGDYNLVRFILLVFLFVLSMIFLIISPNLISILLGWDGLGLVSYCLIIYYQDMKSYNSGMISVLFNRIGDVAILMVIAWMMNYGSLNFIFYVDFMSVDYSMNLIGWMIMLAALTKSAQIPFSSWLPAAMSAPTPVSSLVHSSTLVTAGVYLLIRFNFCLSSFLMIFMLFISSMTMLMSGIGANFEFDLKKIIALSTLSHLGLMISILSLGEYNLSFFHLLCHALFKALLFMCAGCMIHNLCGNQDIRNMGVLIKVMPLTSCFFNISNYSLCGLPFMTGFYSKDLMLDVMSMGFFNFYIYFIFYFSIGLTLCYSVRLCYYSILVDYSYMSLYNLNDEMFIILKGMGMLILFVIFGGSFMSWVMFSTPYFICLPLMMKLMVLFFIFFGIWFGYEMSSLLISLKLKGLIMLNYSSSMFNLFNLSTFGLNYYPLIFGNIYYSFFDQGWSEYFGGNNIYYNLLNFSKFFQLFVDNSLKIYYMLFMIWIFILFIF
uniref:NADH-ubiquinone oxidoreductase chain 5 n=1 Tax=Rhagophthalminae sp. GENSP01 TaxID=1205577 RepID=A0A0S2MNU5_9COLE|nr:NADH deshydrogenase subunit 5 [Rhagophthalminae sp. GENSP01]